MWRSEPELIHPVDAAEIPGWSSSINTTFLEGTGLDDEARLEQIRRRWEPDRTWGVRDNGRWVASLVTHHRTITVPGSAGVNRALDADALTAVTVAATHRRRGLMSEMLTRSLTDARERGDPVAILVAAEWPIYVRFGYAPAAFGAHYALHPRRPGAVVDGDVSRVHQVDRDAYAAAARTVFPVFRGLRAGQVDRDGAFWSAVLGLDGWPVQKDTERNWMLHEGPDGPDGLLAWKPLSEFAMVPPLATIAVDLLAAATGDAYRDLWAYLTGIDGVDEVRLRDRPVDEPVRWMLRDGRALLTTQLRDYLWLRLLDVPAALSARRYAIDGEAVLEVRDEGWAGAVSVAGRYRLRAAGDEVTCEPTTDAPDLTLDQSVLAATYLGGIGLAGLAHARGWEEHTPGAAVRVQTMFSTGLAPWNATGF